MNSFLFALSAVTPIMLMVALGYFIKRIGLVSADFAKPVNRLVFRIFLPCMLFFNIYRIEDLSVLEPLYILYAVAAIMIVFLLAIPSVIWLTDKNERRGVLIQATFRSNFALIGIPLAQSLFGAQGVAVASLLSAACIPVFNILAVISLSVFHKSKQPLRVRKILIDILKNPLIQGVACGLAALGIRMLLIRFHVEFRLSDITPLTTVLTYLSNLATPLALLMLGIQFEFSATGQMLKEIFFGVAARCVVVPTLALGIAYLLLRGRFTGAHFAAFVAIFTTPVAISVVPMAQEMQGDTALAGQLVVWTTLFSALTVFLASFLLKTAGVF